MADLAARSALTPSGLSRAVDRLCEAGVATREACEEDRRGTFARLTPAGARRASAALAAHSERLDSMLGVLDPRERALLAELLARVKERTIEGCTPCAGDRGGGPGAGEDAPASPDPRCAGGRRR